MAKKSASDLEKLYQQFKASAEAVSAEVFRVNDTEAAGRLIQEKITEIKAQTVVAAVSPLVEAVNLPAAADRAGAVLYTEELRRQAAAAELGVSEFDLAIAEIGTIAQDASNINKRLVSSLPPNHLVVIKTDRLVPNLLYAVDLINQNLPGLPNYLSFTTGPSRTSDIERVLTIGVHGPGRLIIVLIDNA